MIRTQQARYTGLPTTALRCAVLLAFAVIAVRVYARPPSVFAQDSQSFGTPQPGCQLLRAEQNDKFGQHGRAYIYGRTERVPRMRIRVRDSDDGRPLEIQRLRVLYAWDWLDYPYPGSELGGWSSAWDQYECSGARPGQSVIVPAFDVQPRGWYGGHFARYPFARKPHVTSIVLDVLVTDSCERKVELSTFEVSRLARDAVVVQTSCAAPSAGTDRSAKLRFEKVR